MSLAKAPEQTNPTQRDGSPQQTQGRDGIGRMQDHPWVASIDTRCLLLSLPNNKFVAWTAIIREVIKQGMTMVKKMESIIVHLGHLGMAIHFIYHFLSRLRNLQERARSWRSININEECHNNLQFMISVIKRAHDGINLNILVYQCRTHVYHSDLCPAGLGGYSNSNSGFAWY
jgi:hypothetical protein